MARIDRTAFAKALHEAHEREHDQRWQDAIDVYADLLASLGPSADPERRAMRRNALERFHRDDAPASLQGRGWAFLNLATLYGKTGRFDLAFVTFTKAQDVLGAAEDWAGVAAAWEAQAQLRRAIQDEDRWREDLGEAIVFYDRAAMKGKAERLRGMLGKKLV